MRKNILFSAALIASLQLFSQVPKKVVVEHFTNTKCSICASRNPGFYTNLNSQTGIIHLAVHPSSPYSGCLLNQHNVSENDARTNYYGIYGSTPRLVIQGVVISSQADYSSASIFTPYFGQTSPASIKIVQSKYGNDSIRSRIVIKTEANHSLGNLKLFVALAEDVITYTGSNGEPMHYDVFRKSLTGATGSVINLPATVGDSVVFTMASSINGDWDYSKIFTLAILQDAVTKAVIQSQSIPASSNAVATGILGLNSAVANINVFVKEKKIVVEQNNVSEKIQINIYGIAGKLLLSKSLENKYEEVEMSENALGIYFYHITSKHALLKTGKFLLN